MIHLPKFETNITSACTLRCTCCDHYSPMLEPWFVPPEQVERDLAAAGRIMHAQDYRLIGGEPTLHKQIDDLIDIAHASGVMDTVSVWTNGMLLKKMTPAFWDKVDGITVTVYPRLGDENLQWIRNKVRDEGVRFQEVHHPHFNRTFSRNPLPAGEAASQYKTCIYRSCNEYDNGWFYHCNNSQFIAQRIMGLAEGVDGINLYTATEEEFRAYLDDKDHHYQACTRCVQTKLIPVQWHEVSRAEFYEESVYNN